MPRQKTKYCSQAKAIIATFARAKRDAGGGWGSGRAGGAASLNSHLAGCMKCGRDLEGKPWPPL